MSQEYEVLLQRTTRFLSEMAGNKVNLTEDRAFIFMHRFNSGEWASDLAADLKRSGMTCWKHRGAMRDYRVDVSLRLAPDAVRIAEIEQELGKRAADFGGYACGWVFCDDDNPELGPLWRGPDIPHEERQNMFTFMSRR